MTALALALAVLPVMQSAGLADRLARPAASAPQLLLPLATDLRPIGHEYKAASSLAAALTQLVLTERFVLAAPSHSVSAAPVPGVGRFLPVECYRGESAIDGLGGTPRSPPNS
ncbi:MAG: hypothetical protein ACREQN_13365 [Candidatus Binataceae bacterium]